LPHLGQAQLDEASASRLRMGQTVPLQGGEAGQVKSGLTVVYGPGRMLLGIGETLPGPVLKPVRLFNHLAPDPT
jgi:hypothetical protein